MSDKYQALISGREQLVAGTVVSTGVSEAGKIIALDATGKIDLTLLPTGVGPLVLLILASENISAGAYVNIWNNAGVANVRKADSTNDRPANGFLKTSVTTGNNATVYTRSGINDSLASMTPGARQYLGAAGARTETVPSTGGGDLIHQYLGTARDATTMIVDIEDEIIL